MDSKLNFVKLVYNGNVTCFVFFFSKWISAKLNFHIAEFLNGTFNGRRDINKSNNKWGYVQMHHHARFITKIMFGLNSKLCLNDRFMYITDFAKLHAGLI